MYMSLIAIVRSVLFLLCHDFTMLLLRIALANNLAGLDGGAFGLRENWAGKPAISSRKVVIHKTNDHVDGQSRIVIGDLGNDP